MPLSLCASLCVDPFIPACYEARESKVPMGGEKQEPGASSGAAEAYAKAAPYLDAAWSLIGSVGVWTGLGLWADSRFGTKPWLVVVGSVGGMALGFYLFFKRLMAADKKARDKKQ